MGRGWTFRLPRSLSDGFRTDLAEACLVGKDALPWPTTVSFEDDVLTLGRDVHESLAAQIPLSVPDFGRLLVQTCALPEGGPYRLLLEVARGEVDKARAELAECERKGLRPSLPLRQTIAHAGSRLTAAVFTKDDGAALEAICAALWCGEALVEEFGRAAASSRKGKSNKPLQLSCVFDERFYDVESPAALRKLFDAVTIPIDWPTLELDTGERQWDALEQRIDWCLDRGLAVTVGPILDLHVLPHWVAGLGDSEAAQMLMLDLVETAAARFNDRVTSWEVAAGAPSSTHFGGDDRALMLLVMKSLEVIRNQDPQARLSLTIDRPWGDYLATGARKTSPFDFLDRLLRIDAPISMLNLDVAIGVDGGSRRRPAVDFRRLLERYGELGPPLSVRLLHPAETNEGPDLVGQSGEDRQADWLETHLLAALAESTVERIEWGRLHDLPGQRWPGCGLFSESREPRRALRRLRAVRKACF